MPSASLRLAVVGAGAAGLAAARELRREGHAPVVFERAAAVGGTWLYTPPATAADPLGASATHSSLYASLRTNLPREVMGFLDFPFVASAATGFADPRRFPGHEEVLRYLKAFAARFDLLRLVRFETEVVRVRREAGGGWAVASRKLGEKGSGEEEVYDAVVVCNGHYTEPRIATIPGVDAWPGKQMHSHNYREPEPFLDQVVIVIGASASAVDISRDVASVAKEVHIADRSAPASTCEKQPSYDNLWLHSMINRAQEDGSVVFQDGSSIKADVIMHCTGYLYDFPFLGDDSTISVDDNRVDPLYKHVFPPEVAHQLSFIGLPWKVIPFPLFELQGKWVAGVLSGRIKLPSKDEMMDDVKAYYSKLEARGWPKRYTHNFSNYQFVVPPSLRCRAVRRAAIAGALSCSSPCRRRWCVVMHFVTLSCIPASQFVQAGCHHLTGLRAGVHCAAWARVPWCCARRLGGVMLAQLRAILSALYTAWCVHAWCSIKCLTRLQTLGSTMLYSYHVTI